jgi:flagellar protein FliS
MTTHPEQKRAGDQSVGGEQYLESTVRTASPARLRLMLIERAVDVAECLSNVWREKQQLGANEHWIKLLDLLNELLGGVVGGKTDGENVVCQKVADLYVFLSKHLVAAEPSSDANSIDEIKAVLEVEAETWRAVCAMELPRQSRPDFVGGVENAGGLNLEA